MEVKVKSKLKDISQLIGSHVIFNTTSVINGKDITIIHAVTIPLASNLRIAMDMADGKIIGQNLFDIDERLDKLIDLLKEEQNDRN